MTECGDVELHSYIVRCQITYDAAEEVLLFYLRRTRAGRLIGERIVIPR